LSATIDLSKNEKQKQYFNDVMMSLKSGIYKYFAFGGAIRGGKTYVTLFILIVLCKIYPNSKWVVIRKDLPALQKTTIPSLKKLLKDSPNWKWHNNPSNIHVTNLKTGASIFFYAENIKQDPDLNTFLGLECNGIFMEQAEELSEKMQDMALQRSGSWYIDPMPPPFIFYTFNPTHKWVKKKFYVPFSEGTLQAPFYFLQALPSDNPFVTAEQWSAWQLLDPITKGRMIEADWNSFAVKKAFAYSWDDKKHIHKCEYDPGHYLYLSFDFNRDPITCIVRQYIDGQIRYIKEYRIETSNIEELCDYVLADFHDAVLIVTGDATGRNSTALVRGNLNYWKVIKSRLGLSDSQMKVPKSNPSVKDTRIITNSILTHFDLIIDPSCEFLIDDLRYCEVDENGDIDKDKDKHKTHLLDCLRYDLNTHFKHLIHIPRTDEPEEKLTESEQD